MLKGFIIAGTGSGVGKTSIATGLMSVLSKRYRVQAFKVGPDFIDPMYHRVATGRTSYNLDSFMMSDDAIRRSVGNASKDADMCVIEGVRGLYEGSSGTEDIGSTAYIAKLLSLPVVLVVDASSLTRSACAIVNGFRSFDPDINIAGVILNKVSGEQHSRKLDEAFERYCPGIRLLGKIGKDRTNTLEQRHLGLRTLNKDSVSDILPLEAMVEPLDTDRLMDIMETFPTDLPSTSPYIERNVCASVAVPYDSAYSFYYNENLECLKASGFDIKYFSPVSGDMMPDADALYLGGGYPELYAEEISSNRDFLDGIRNMSLESKPVLGECGGLMTLCRTMTDKDRNVYRMSGALDADSVFVNKRHGPTYVVGEPINGNPMFAQQCKGHEYHYSEVYPDNGQKFGFEMKRGIGIQNGKDGLFIRNTVGTYMHQHALSTDDWAKGFVDLLR